MKKVLCALAAAVVGFTAFAEGKGGLSFCVDSKAVWSSAAVADGTVGFNNDDSGLVQGFNVKQGEDDFYLQLAATYETSVGGAMFRLRSNLIGQYNLKQGFLSMDRYEAWINPFDFLKVSIGNNPIELYAESVRWDTFSGAGIFENANLPHLYVELYRYLL